VKARSYADVDCLAYETFGLLDTFAEANAFSEAQAIGVYGGDGNDVITNYGAVTADALTVADAESYADVGLGSNPHGVSEAEATARAAGIDAGAQGRKEIHNFGSIEAVANAGARPRARSDSETMNTYANGYGLAESQAFGITSDGLHDLVTNHETGSISVTALAGTYDTLGNTGYVNCDEIAVSGAGYAWAPLKADGVGIALSDGSDIVVNDGSITVFSHVDGSIYTHTLNRSAVNANPDSVARSFVLSQATGIAAGAGSNEVTNNGLLTVEASSYAAPKAYSWSQFVSTSANAYGVSDAVAVGLEADGAITNSLSGVLDVTAWAKSFANSPTESESAKATALLTATATGFRTFTDAGLTEIQRITNQGTATIRAIAGEGNDGYCAYVNSGLTSGSAVSEANGTLTVDAAGIRVGDGVKEIINTGTLNVLGRQEYLLANATATSTYARSTTTSYGEGIATATGVLATAGENHIHNLGTMDVNADIDVYTRAFSDSGWQSTYTTYATSETSAKATGQGIRVGDGDDEIINMGLLTVASTARATSYARSDEYATSTATSEAVAVGIDGGSGTNTIINEGDMYVSAAAWTVVSAAGDHTTRTPHPMAWVIGITAGQDDDWILNSGTLEVQANQYANLAASGQGIAIGIFSGAGNDVIINEGSIVIRAGGSFLTNGSGIAIDAGAGDDTVILADGSSIVGDVLLGSGDDLLVLAGRPVVEGLIRAGDNSDTLVLDGAGWFDHHLEGFDHAMKQGPGTYTVSGLSPATRLDLGEGTLEIDGNYQFAEVGLLTTMARADGSAGQLKIGGTGALDGTLAVEREQGLYRQATYDVVMAEALSGSFADVSLPESSLLLEFAVEQTADRVQVSVTPHSYASVASNQMEREIGEHLDRIAPQATGNLANTLGTFQTLSGNEFGTAFTSLGPAVYDSATATTFNATTQYNQTLFKRMHSTRAHIERTDGTLAYSQTERHAAWMDGFGHWARQDSQGGFAGYDYRLAGVALGGDRLMEDDLLVGVSYGQSRADIDMDNNLGKGDIDSHFGSLYGSYFTDRMYVDATLSYGRQHYRNSRKIKVGDLNGTAHSSHDGDVYSAHGETGWNLRLDRWTLQPFAALRYTLLDEQGYTESGAEGVNLRVKGRKTDALISNLGLRFACHFEKDDWLCIPEATVAWDHDFDLDDRRITAAFDGSPTTTFVTEGRDIDRDGLVLGAGLTLIRKNNLSLSVKYTGELRSHYKAHGLTGGIRYEF